MLEESDVRAIRGVFEKLKGKRIVIYGIGPLTEQILDVCGDFTVVGLMDGYRNNGTIYSKEILSYDDVMRNKVDAIVVAARVNSVKIIVARIAQFCIKNNILLIDIFGEDRLQQDEKKLQNNAYFDVSEDDLIKAIDEHEVISFDVFDTLIMRKVLYPTDVFFVIAQNCPAPLCEKLDFVHERIAAAKEASVSIDSTYDQICKSTGILEIEAEQLKTMEFQTEKQLMIPRKKMLDIYNYARKQGKIIYLVSDMYWRKNMLETILHHNGIEGYADVLVSCDCGTTKAQSLFKHLKDRLGDRRCLHIGDDYEADYKAPKVYNIDSFLLMSAANMLGISAYSALLENDQTFSGRILLGLFVQQMFNNPFALFKSNGLGKIDNAFSLGNIFVAPLLAVFVHRMIEDFKKMQYDSILFLARDGYLVLKLYEMASDYLLKKRTDVKALPPGIYFMASRIACVSASISEASDIYRVIRPSFDGSPELLLKTRFLLNENDIEKYNHIYTNFEEYISIHKDKIILQSNCLRKAYCKYAEGLSIKSEGKVALFDFVATGTCHILLQKILKKRFDGYYFSYLPGSQENQAEITVQDFLHTDSSLADRSFANECYLFLESLVSSPTPSLRCFNQDGEPVYIEESRSQLQIQDIMEAQLGIVEYFKDYIQLTGLKVLPNAAIADKILSCVKNEYSRIEQMRLFDTALIDDFMNRKYSLLDCTGNDNKSDSTMQN